MRLFRLIEQACSCSTVRGGGGLKVLARLCLWHSGGECLLYRQWSLELGPAVEMPHEEAHGVVNDKSVRCCDGA